MYTHSRQTTLLLGVVLLALPLFFPSTVRAEEPKRFQLSLIPYVWLPAIDGDIGIGPLTASADVCFTEIAQEATCLIGAFGRVAGWYDRVGFYVDAGYTSIRFEDHTVLGTDFDVDTDLGVVDFGILLKLADWELGG